MATLTIRDLDEALKQTLRVRAAGHSRSMEEEARQILRAALTADAAARPADLAERIRARVDAFGGVDLPIPAREPVREPPQFGIAAPPRRAATRKPPARKGRRG